MSTGIETIEWLYNEQLKIDKEWSVRTVNGFRWWAHRLAQTIGVVGQEAGPDGDPGFFISVRTDVLRGVTLSEENREWLNRNVFPQASMAGLVYDMHQQTLSLASMVRIHRGIAQWMRPVISVVAAIQLAEAKALGGHLSSHFQADIAESGPPGRELRLTPDEIDGIVDVLLRPLGRNPSPWGSAEFNHVVDTYMRQPPSLLATAGDSGFAVEFPFGVSGSSLCMASADGNHPMLGNGLSVTQSFPVTSVCESEGIEVALALNRAELTERPFGYGFGSYFYDDGKIQFVSFYPNAIYSSGLLANVYFACAGRAREMSVRLSGVDWNSDSFTPGRSSLGILSDLLRRPRRHPSL